MKFTIANLSLNIPMIEYYLDSENITNVFSSICKKHNSTLDRLVPPLLDHIWVKNLNSNVAINGFKITNCLQGQTAKGKTQFPFY